MIGDQVTNAHAQLILFLQGAYLVLHFSHSSSRGITATLSRIEDMAEGPDPNNKALDELEKDITCAVCCGHYQEAKLLPCNHYYCRACIESLAKRSRGRPFPCPECRNDAILPSGGVEKLQSAFFVERMKDLYDKMAKVEGKVEAVCEQCSKGKSVAFCRQCTDFICAECTTLHGKLKPFADHKVATLEELKMGGAKDVPLKEAPPPKCPDHGEPMKIFCFDCNRLICCDCTLIDHNGHSYNFLNKSATEARKTLRDSLTPLRNVQANIASADKKLAGTEAQVGSQKEMVCKSVRQSFHQLKAVLEQRETELVKKVLTMAQEKKDALTAQRKGLQMAQTEIQSLVEFVERNVENTSDQDLMNILSQLQSKVDEGEKRHQQLSLDPSTTADLAYHSPSLKAIPRDLGEVFQQKVPAILGEIVNTCKLGETTQVTIAAPTAQSTDIHAQLQNLADPASSLQADVVVKGAGVYHITYTPRVRGRHDLTVKVNGQDITGSPFLVFVKIHPTQLGPPVRTITGVNQPWGIATNSKQQLVVAEYGEKKITIREQDGKTLQTIKNDKLRSPRGVATGPDGAIYVTNDEAHCLFKFDKDGRLLKTVQNEFQSPYFIKFINNRLYVSDLAKNVVKVLDTDCNVIGTIPTKECPAPFDITEGEDGLYVVGGGKEGKIGVYTCAPNGEFRRHLNIQPSSVTLSNPRGICFDCSGNLFVTQGVSGVGRVYVFKPSGEHVATLGQASSGVWMWSPAGIAIDEDGFVYVCDIWSHNVLVF